MFAVIFQATGKEGGGGGQERDSYLGLAKVCHLPQAKMSHLLQRDTPHPRLEQASTTTVLLS